jgi:F420-0:gamma-glutamyl ligase
MQFIPIKTRIFLPPKDDLFQIFDEYISEVKEGDIIFITSKILAIHQGRCIPVGTIEKSDLIKQEADSRTISDAISGHDTYLTLKNNILIPTAGIDESNANGHYILRPEHLPEATKQIYDYFSQRFLIKNI